MHSMLLYIGAPSRACITSFNNNLFSTEIAWYNPCMEKLNPPLSFSISDLWAITPTSETGRIFDLAKRVIGDGKPNQTPSGSA